MYQSQDCGIFVGLATIPLESYHQRFWKDMQALFSGYKQDLLNSFMPTESKEDKKAIDEFNEHFYEPTAYYMLGSFDVAIISLTDSFELGTRIFQPYSKFISQNDGLVNEPECFVYQTTIGILPDLGNLCKDKEKPYRNTVIEKAQNTFRQDLDAVEKPKPFIGITYIKYNNNLIIGGGGRFNTLALQAIKACIEKVIKDKTVEDSFDYIIMHSLSWNELNILFFSEDIGLINDVVLKLRSLNLNEALNIVGGKEGIVYEDMLIYNFEMQCGKTKQEAIEAVKNTQLFVNTTTLFGVHYDFADKYLNNGGKFKKIVQKQRPELKLRTEWHIKPGHLKPFLEDIKKQDTELEDIKMRISITSGRGDYAFVYPYKCRCTEECECKDNNLSEFLKLFSGLAQVNQNDPNTVNRHVRKKMTTLEFTYNLKELKYYPDEIKDIFLIHEYIKKYIVFANEVMEKIEQKLKRENISQIIQTRVINMFVLFNSNIQDPISYGFFAELYPFLLLVKKFILIELNRFERDTEPTKDITKTLDDFCRIFEEAYKNRFHQSHLMGEVIDVNINFNGGIQQLLTAFDWLYKALSNLTEHHPSFAHLIYVVGQAGITSTPHRVELNHLHLYQPETFLSVALHEAANFYIEEAVSKYYINNRSLTKLYNEVIKVYPSPIQYVLVDLTTFFVAYNADWELFFQWHLCSFMQHTHNYKNKFEISDNHLFQFMMRMELVRSLAKMAMSSSSFSESMPPDGLPESENLPCLPMREQWEMYLPKVRQLVASYLKIYENEQDDPHKNLKIWFDECLAIVQTILVDDYCSITERHTYTYNQLMARYKHLLGDFYEQTESDVENRNALRINELIGRRKAEMEAIAGLMVEALKEGKVYGHDKDFPALKGNSSFYVNCLCLAYLKLLLPWMKEEGKILVRDRIKGERLVYGSEKTKKNAKEVPTKHSPYYIDPLGGIFVCTAKGRREYFKYRTTFWVWLWSIAQRKKTKLFCRSLSEPELLGKYHGEVIVE